MMHLEWRGIFVKKKSVGR